MKRNYFTIHKNKKPKKPKYSNPYTKAQKLNFEKCIQDFERRIELIKQNAMVSVKVNQNTIDNLNKIASIVCN